MGSEVRKDSPYKYPWEGNLFVRVRVQGTADADKGALLLVVGGKWKGLEEI